MSEREPAVSELVERLTGQVSRLVHQEAALAQEELLTKASKAGMGATLFAGAGMLTVYGAGVVVAGVVVAVATVLPAWAAALIIGGVLLPAAGALALAARRRVRGALPMPRRIAANVAAGVRTIARKTGR